MPRPTALDEADVWRFDYLEHENGVVSSGPGIFAAFPPNGKPAYAYVVKATKQLNGGTYCVFGYGYTDLEAVQNALTNAKRVEDAKTYSDRNG